MFSQEKSPKDLEREARKDVREGNELYNQLKFEEAEISYKKALDKNPNYAKASYNLANTIYQKNQNKEAVFQYDLAEKIAPNKMSKAEIFHNMGNSFMKEKQYDKAVDAYKNAMRNNSKDEETRYNLNGIYLHVKNGEFLSAATDAHRFSIASSKIEANINDFGV